MGTVESASCYQMILNKHVQFVTLSDFCLHVHKDITTLNVLANMTLSCLFLTFLVNDSFFVKIMKSTLIIIITLVSAY